MSNLSVLSKVKTAGKGGRSSDQGTPE